MKKALINTKAADHIANSFNQRLFKKMWKKNYIFVYNEFSKEKSIIQLRA